LYIVNVTGFAGAGMLTPFPVIVSRSYRCLFSCSTIIQLWKSKFYHGVKTLLVVSIQLTSSLYVF